MSHKITFQNDNGENLSARLELPHGTPKAYAIFAHCFTCSKDIAAASRIANGLSKVGIAVLRFDFTGLGNSDGDFANTNFSSNVGDLICAANYLEKNYMAPTILVGHSLGGAAVLSAASKLDYVKAVITVGAPSDPGHVSHLFENNIPKIMEDGSAEVNLAGRKFKIKKQFIEDIQTQKITSQISTFKKALLIMHSPIDNLVSVDHARKIYEAAKHPKSYVSLDTADHLLTKKKDSEYVAQVISAWVARYLPEPTEKEDHTAIDDGTVWVRERDGKFTQNITVGKHFLTADEPQSYGGANLGPTPYGFLLSGLGACTTMTIRMYATHKKLPLEHVSVKLKHEKVAHHHNEGEDPTTPKAKHDHIYRDIELKGDLTQEQRQRILEIADKCPVHRTLESPDLEVITKLMD